jgi:ubiquinone/menaquinone biosynthesis C-methylase UbiE
MFEVGEAYESMMGRWSRQLAPRFIDFVGVMDGERVLDVGCGTGSLAGTLARITKASKIVGIDPSSGFIEYARAQNADPRVTFEVGDAQQLHYPNASFDRCMALLAVDYFPDARKAASEMCRVTRKAGIVATAMWDRSRGRNWGKTDSRKGAKHAKSVIIRFILSDLWVLSPFAGDIPGFDCSSAIVGS